MAPSKVPRGGHDDSKPETPASTAKDKASHPNHQSNGKSRRAAGSAASHAREVTNAPPPPANATASAAPQEHSSLKARYSSLFLSLSFTLHQRSLSEPFTDRSPRTINSFSGRNSRERCSTLTAEPTASTPRPPSPAITANGSYRDRGA